MNEEIKDLLYELAVGIIDLFHENAKLKAENKELKKYKTERVKEDQEYLKRSQENVTETLALLLGVKKEN